MSDFQAFLLEGLFYLEGEQDLRVRTEDTTSLRVFDVLSKLKGRNVQISAHHLPPSRVDPTRWGGGCCMWQSKDSPGSSCPFGHHQHPTRLLNIVAQGVLQFKEGPRLSDGLLVVHMFDGTQVDLWDAFTCHLPGHYGRIAVATIVDLEKMREALLKSGGLDVVDGLGERAQDLKGLMEHIRSGTDGKS